MRKDQVVSAMYRGSAAMRRHVRSPSGMFEAHLFNEVSPRELRNLQTGGGEGVQVWPIQEADAVS